jgi:hypothetical protein
MLDDLIEADEIDLIIEILVATERSWTARIFYDEFVRVGNNTLLDEQLGRLIDLWAENPADPENMAFIAENIEMTDEQQSRLEEAWGVSFDELTVSHKQ